MADTLKFEVGILDFPENKRWGLFIIEERKTRLLEGDIFDVNLFFLFFNNGGLYD